MAIKWKKSHPALSFLFFCLAVHMSAAAVVMVVSSCNMVGYNIRSGDPFSVGPAGEWQTTNRFHSDLSGVLNTVLQEQLEEGYAEETAITAADSGYNLKIAVKRGENQVINTFSGSVPAAPKDLEEGYSYLLTFDGKETRAFWKGNEQELGASGGWFVPGFGETYWENDARYKDALKSISVVIAVKEEPQISGFYGYYGESLIYSGYTVFQEAQKIFIGGAALLPAALLFFVLYILRRKEKAAADRKIASGLSHIPLLIKLLAGVSLGIFLASPLAPAAAYFLIWFLYFLYCDLWFNRKEFFRNTCIHRAALQIARFQNSLPAQKRLISNSWLAAGSVVLSSILFWFFAALIPPYIYSPAYSLWIVVWILCEIAILAFFERRKFRMADDLRVLLQAVSDVYNGKYENVPDEIPAGFQYEEALRELQSIRKGLETALQKEIEAVEAKIKNERMKIDLITNVSHDIRTPLTSIIGYVELLKEEESLPEHVKEYIHVLDEKSQRLRSMVEDVFDMSKATSGNMKLNVETLDFARLLRQTLADMEDRIDEAGFAIRTAFPETPVWIRSDGARLYRVLQNLLQNALQYSLEGSRIRIALRQEGASALLKIRNISSEELPEGTDFTERFFRGDTNRSSEGSGLGLSIAKSFTEACGGVFSVVTQEDVFTVEIVFPVISPPETEPADLPEEKESLCLPEGQTEK